MMWFPTLVLVSGLCWTTGRQEAGIPELPADAFQLANGLSVVLHRDASVPRVTVCVAYHVGSKNERAGRTGFAHFFEHMMFRGTANVPNYDIPLQESGASSNAFTSEDMTVYFETVPSHYLERALYLEAERLAHLDSALDQDKFDTEREVVKNERRQSFENVPYGLADEAIAAHLFPLGHPYSWSVIGSMKDLNQATLEDLKQFFAEFYHPGNATLCLAGDFDPEQARGWINKYFGALAAGPPIPKVTAAAAPPVDRQFTLLDRVEAPRVYWSWPTVAGEHPDAAALEMLAALLTDSEASRLYQALVRDGQLATDVDASSDTREVAGLFSLAATAAEGKTPEEISAVMSAALRQIQDSPPAQAEIERARAQYEKSAYSRLTSPFSRALTLAIGQALYGDPSHFQREFQRYFQVTPQDVQRVARKYLTPARLTLIVRPVQPGEEESKAAQAGPLADDQQVIANTSPRLAKGAVDWTIMPAPTAETQFTPPTPQQHELSNGLQVWVLPWRTLPIVQCALVLPIGSADDPPGKEGLATLTASVWDKGVDGMTAVKFAEALDALGSEVVVRAGTEWTTISISALRRNFEPTLDLVAKMLDRPLLADDEFQREKLLLQNELLQGRAVPGVVASRTFRSLLFGEHPYARPSQGYASSVAAISVDDVRSFYGRMGSKGAALIVVGDVEPKTIVQELEQRLAAWRKTAQSSERSAPRETGDASVLYLVDQPGSVQSILYLGRQWKNRQDPSFLATQIGNRIFGDDFLSRLNQNLRERNGFTYGASSQFNYLRRGSYWIVGTSVRADATAPALQELLNELKGISGERPFSDEEIAVNQQAELLSFPERFAGPASIAGALAELVEFNLPADYFQNYATQLRSVDAAAIRHSIEELARSKHRVNLVVGDRQLIEAELRKLPFHEVRLIQPPESYQEGPATESLR